MLSINAFLLKTQEVNLKAIHSNSLEMDYEQLRKRVLETAIVFNSFGINRKENVAIIGNNETQFLINVLALWQINAVPVLINPRSVKDEINRQIHTTNCKVVLQSNKIKAFDPEFNIKVFKYPFTTDQVTNKTNISDELYPEDTAVIIFTSGVSGDSKGVELSFNNLLQSARIGDQVINHNKNDRALASLPFYHIGGFSIFTRVLLFSASIIIPDSIQTEELSAAINKFKPTLCSFVPTQLKRMLSAEIQPNDELRIVLLGGGVIEQRLVYEAISVGWSITKVYGLTETASFITALAGEDVSDKPKSVGKAVKPNRIIIVNENRFQIPWGEVGEIAVSSLAVMKGYFHNEIETNNKFEDGYFLTGDIGYLDADGFLYIEARKTDLIVTGGENVNPNEVEKRITEHPDIIDAAVFPIIEDEWGEVVTAAVVLKDSKIKINIDELRQFLKKDLAGFKLPKKLFVVKKLPRNELGKILRGKLIEEFEKKR